MKQPKTIVGKLLQKLGIRQIFEQKNLVKIAVDVTNALKKAVDSKEAFFITEIIFHNTKVDDALRDKLSKRLAEILRYFDLASGRLLVESEECSDIRRAGSREKYLTAIAGELLHKIKGIPVDTAIQLTQDYYKSRK